MTDHRDAIDSAEYFGEQDRSDDRRDDTAEIDRIRAGRGPADEPGDHADDDHSDAAEIDRVRTARRDGRN